MHPPSSGSFCSHHLDRRQFPLRAGALGACVDAVARTNVEMTMASIRTSSEILRELESQGNLKIAGAMYDVSTAKVDFYD